MYIKTERNNSELKMNKICSKNELINEIKTLANTLVDDISNEKKHYHSWDYGRKS